MRSDKAVSWYRRMSAVYALGTWTLLGSLFFLGRKSGKPSGGELDPKDASISEITEPPKGFYVETIVTYKEDFVPITDRILNYWKSWTGGPGPES